MRAKRWPRLIWLLGGLALVLALFRGPALGARRSSGTVANQSIAWYAGGFIPGGVYPTTDPGALPAGMAAIGSWNNGDQWQGGAETVWLPVSPRPRRVCVAGYPQHPGCRLWAEFRRADGSVVPVACPIADPHETWSPWDLRPPAGAEAMRLVAEDRASDNGGWLAFSELMDVPTQAFGASYMAAQVFATLALALTLVWGPGLLWAPQAASDAVRVLWLLGAGPLTLAALGALIWLLDGAVAPQVLGFAFVGVLWLAVGVSLGRRPLQLTTANRRVLAVSALVVVATVAKATYAGGPQGELFAGTISRTLAVGDRSDARISFHVMQAAARHVAPGSAATERYFTPWTFFSRGPLAGLAAFPIALATAGPPPVGMPDRSWTPFDDTGFAAYRIVLMTLASTAILALFSVLVPLAGERWALIGAGLAALCPFGVHEIMFTWPKWEATAWVLASFLLAHQRRPLGAGLALAVGFFFHPMAALWAPWLALWAGGRAARGAGPFLGAGFRFAAGFGALALPWMVLGQLLPHLEGSVHAGQGGFFEYFKLAGYAPATWASWWNSRAINFANTFVPFWLHAFHENNSVIGSVYGPTGSVVKFAFGWWNTLPLGLGLGLWALSLLALARAARRFAAAIGLLLAGPALLLTAYWGAYVTGLMRECGHPLLAALIGLLCVALAHFPGRLASLVAHPVFPWLQLPETLLMLWLTTFLNPRQPGVDFAVLSPLYFLISVIALIAAAGILSRARDDSNPSRLMHRSVDPSRTNGTPTWNDAGCALGPDISYRGSRPQPKDPSCSCS